jgi:hypothetical protein
MRCSEAAIVAFTVCMAEDDREGESFQPNGDGHCPIGRALSLSLSGFPSHFTQTVNVSVGYCLDEVVIAMRMEGVAEGSQ